MYKEYLKIYITRLKNTFAYKILLNNYFLIVLYIIFLLSTITHPVTCIIFIIYNIFLYKKSKEILKVSLLFSFIILIIFLFIKLTIPFNNENEKTELVATVYDIEKKDNYNKIIIFSKTKKYIVISKENPHFDIGYIIHVNGRFNEIDSNYNEGEFNYLEYLKNNKYSGYILSEKIEVLKKNFSIFRLKTYLDSYLDNFPVETKKFISALLFASSSDLDEEFYASLKDNGIIHLFAVSGLHISLFLGMFEKLYKTIKVKENLQTLINISFLVTYLIITDFTPSIMRVSVSYVIKLISEKYFKNHNLSSLDVQSLSFILLLIINPLYIYDLGFNLSYLAAFTIILSSRLVDKYNELIKTILFSVFSMIMTLPQVINMSYEINLLIPLTNLLFISLVSYVILPLTIAIFFFPFLSNIYLYIITSFQELSIFISKYLNVMINIPSMNTIVIILYYLIVFLVFRFIRLYKEKIVLKKTIIINFLVILLLLVFILTRNGYNFSDRIYFLYLENGEATVILSDDTVIVIDTGTGEKQEVSNFLKSKGIKRIDGLILTHNHNDHNGEAKELLNNFLVTKIILSSYDNSEYAYYDISERVHRGSTVSIKDISFRILSPTKDCKDENDNSLVFILNVLGKKILFLGDLTKTGEKEILGSLEDVDIIKIGHHGSNTSTSQELLDKTKPEIAVIMTGRVKQFGFPSKRIVDLLTSNNIKVYKTNTDYMITYKNGKFYTLN